MARRALLDVNVLVALFTPEHVHHDAAHDWFAGHDAAGWATCAITEHGFIRVATRLPRAENLLRPETAIAHFTRFRRGARHKFWAETITLTDPARFRAAFIRGPQQVTDIYLLGLAVAQDGCLATFDGTIPLKAVVGATRDHLQVIGVVG